MRKFLLLITFIFTLTLSACELDLDWNGQNINSSPEYVTHSELESLVSSLVTASVTEGEIIAIVQQHIPHDLTESELVELIKSLLPEDQRTTTYDLKAFQDDIVDMLETRRQSVIGLQVERLGSGSIGSGVIYKAEMSSYDGGRHTYYVVTNHHVIENAQSITVVYERFGILNEIPSSDVELLGSNATTDIAVVTFKSTETFPTVEFANSYDIRPGEFVFAIGNPLGFSYYGSVTKGIISGTARFLTVDDFDATVIQHDAAISPGNSGGALFDINGRVIGINHMKLDQAQAANIGFAVPSNTVERIVRDLEEFGFIVRPFLGITASPFFSDCDYEYGACISSVVAGGAAEAAGIQAGDAIIGFKHEGDEEFMDVFNFNDLREHILNSRVGDVVIILYVRDGEYRESDPTTLDSHPDD